MSEIFDHELWVPTPPGSCKMGEMGQKQKLNMLHCSKRGRELVKQLEQNTLQKEENIMQPIFYFGQHPAEAI